jgi:hypothetical protein
MNPRIVIPNSWNATAYAASYGHGSRERHRYFKNYRDPHGPRRAAAQGKDAARRDSVEPDPEGRPPL